MRLSHLATLGLCVVSWAALSSPPAPKKTPSAAGRLTSDVQKLQEEVAALSLRLNRLESADAEFSTEAPGYGICRTTHGLFFVFQEGLVRYLDGYKVNVILVNTTSVTFKGATIQVSWGPPVPDYAAEVDAWIAAQKSKDVPVLETFPPGVGVPVELILTPARARDVKNLRVGLTLNEIRYLKGQ
jgi:hypothetical protein